MSWSGCVPQQTITTHDVPPLQSKSPASEHQRTEQVNTHHVVHMRKRLLRGTSEGLLPSCSHISCTTPLCAWTHCMLSHHSLTCCKWTASQLLLAVASPSTVTPCSRGIRGRSHTPSPRLGQQSNSLSRHRRQHTAHPVGSQLPPHTCS